MEMYFLRFGNGVSMIDGIINVDVSELQHGGRRG